MSLKDLLEDKFVFAGIRDYQSYDSIRDVNWNACARTGKLMVNQYNETVSRNVCILLNLESEGVLMQEDVIEQAISIAAGLAQLLIGKGINVHFICYHKSRVEAYTELTDNVYIILFCIGIVVLEFE